MTPSSMFVMGRILPWNAVAAIGLPSPATRATLAAPETTVHLPEAVGMKRSLLAAVLLAFPLARLSAQAQATTGVIRGVVLDPNGAPVSGAQVVLHETQTNFQRTLATDAGGNFAASLLPLGIYD